MYVEGNEQCVIGQRVKAVWSRKVSVACESLEVNFAVMYNYYQGPRTILASCSAAICAICAFGTANDERAKR